MNIINRESGKKVIDMDSNYNPILVLIVGIIVLVGAGVFLILFLMETKKIFELVSNSTLNKFIFILVGVQFLGGVGLSSYFILGSIKDMRAPLESTTSIITKIRWGHRTLKKQIWLEDGHIFAISKKMARALKSGDKVTVWFTPHLKLTRRVEIEK